MKPEGLEKMVAELLLTQKSMKADFLTLMNKLDVLETLIEKRPGIHQGWLRSEEAAIALKSEGVQNARHLRKLRKTGVLSGEHSVRNISRGKDRPTWEYHIPRCRKALENYFKPSK